MSCGTLDTRLVIPVSLTGLLPSLVPLSSDVQLQELSITQVRTPIVRRPSVWALPISLAATLGIDVSFSSSAYLDVSVQRVPFHTLCIGVWMTEVFSAGFPHSDISGSMDICSSPKLFAAYHVFHRLLVPRHPPCALSSITNSLLPREWDPVHMHSVACVGISGRFFTSFSRRCKLIITLR